MAERKRLFDSEAFYKALDETRQTRGLNWKQVGSESQVNTSTLARLAQNKNPDADGLAALSAWSGLNPANYVRGVEKAEKPETLTAIGDAIRNDPNLNAESRDTLQKIISTAYTSFAGSKRTRE